MRRGLASDCTHLGELTSAQIFKHAIRFGVQARISKNDYLCALYHRLALGYARLAGKRDIEEQEPRNGPTVE